MDDTAILVGLSAILVLGVGSQWVAWRIRVPAILLLLSVGCVCGPVTGLLDPERIFGRLLAPLVSLFVGVILFEGGLTLRFRDLRGSWRSLVGLITIGAVVSWAVTTVAALALLKLPIGVSLLLGSILIVTGPTVIGPLLRDIRPSGRVGAIARWEGIVIDPIGAVLAVLVFETIDSIDAADYSHATRDALRSLAVTASSGILIGGAAAGLLVLLIRRFWVPDYLQNAVALTLSVAALTTANSVHSEAGLVAVTVMGLLLANQRIVPVQRIAEFKENLTVLLISVLFIVLAARVQLSSLAELGWRGMAFVGVLIAVVRPLAVWLSTIGSGLKLRERMFLALFAPRGIVAASVGSVFALRLGGEGAVIAPATLLVVFVTVLFYGLTAGRIARQLGLAVADPQGFLFVGGNIFTRKLAAAVQSAGFPVVLIDTRYDQVQKARTEGVPAYCDNVLAEHVLDNIDLGGIGRFAAMTTNDEVNTLSATRFRELFGRSNVYQVTVAGARSVAA
ncbi:MAG: sodium:proton antiporter, partial [Planctomycetaceae bacterium]